MNGFHEFGCDFCGSVSREDEMTVDFRLINIKAVIRSGSNEKLIKCPFYLYRDAVEKAVETKVNKDEESPR